MVELSAGMKISLILASVTERLESLRQCSCSTGALGLNNAARMKPRVNQYEPWLVSHELHCVEALSLLVTILSVERRHIDIYNISHDVQEMAKNAAAGKRCPHIE